jgi:hypothetical protein
MKGDAMILDELHIYLNMREAENARKRRHLPRGTTSIRYSSIGSLDSLLGVRTKKLEVHDHDNWRLTPSQGEMLTIIRQTALLPE